MNKILHIYLLSEKPDKDTAVSRNLQKTYVISTPSRKKDKYFTQRAFFIWF